MSAYVLTGVVGAASVLWLLYGRRGPAEELSGRHVLITGGSEGMGLELAKLCAARGAKVSLVARTTSKLMAARKAIREATSGASVATFSGDVADRGSVADAVAKAEEAHGPVDIAVAAAGAAVPKYFEDLTSEDFEWMLKVNYLGVVHLSQAVLPGMTARGAGHFCAVSSMAAAVPFIGYSAYAPAKAACRAFVDVLRNEFADTGVQFHISFPPDTDTPGYAKENKSKPYETSHIWPECFNEVFPADAVSRQLLDGILSGHYFIHSPDVFGNLLVSRSWGHYPGRPLLLETIISPIFVWLHAGMVWLADRAVRLKRHHSKL